MEILFIEDDERNRQLVRSVVRSQLDGAQLVEVATAFDLIDALQKDHFDAIIASPLLAWTNPSEMLRGLDRHLPGVPVITLTSDPDSLPPDTTGFRVVDVTHDNYGQLLCNALRHALGEDTVEIPERPRLMRVTSENTRTLEVMPVRPIPTLGDDVLSIEPAQSSDGDEPDSFDEVDAMVRNGFPDPTYGIGISDAVVLDVNQPLLDNLTSLPNRALCLNRIGRAIQRARLDPDYNFCALHIDIDRFQLINDSLGHVTGDELLVQFARRVSGKLRPEDTFGRLAGDEFCILLEPIQSLAEASIVATRIEQSLLQSFQVAGHEVFVTASIGIVEGSTNYEAPEDIIRDAGLAMYRAKRNGAARHEVFDAGLRDKAVKRLEIDTGLRRALLRGEFVLHYQPIVDVETTRLAGYEALLRWNSPTLGLVYPDTFIEVAEETGVIVDIGHWVLDAAIEALSSCPGVEGGPALTMSVNLSPRQFRCEDLASTIQQSLERHKVTPERLILEITEHVFVEHTGVAEQTFRALGELGVKIDLDDFGTGFSSLSCLRQFPIDRLKIDRSFVEGMTRSDRDREIVRAILALGHNLGKGVIAEGIETRAQLDALRELGCEYGQGYYFSRPMRECDSGQYQARAS